LKYDTIAIGAFHAVERVILVVASAGNNGPSLNTVVNDVPWIFTVTASSIDRDFKSNVVFGHKLIQVFSIYCFEYFIKSFNTHHKYAQKRILVYHKGNDYARTLLTNSLEAVNTKYPNMMKYILIIKKCVKRLCHS